MSDNNTILAIPGSMRTGSFNLTLLKIAVAMAQERGANVDLMDPQDLNIPLYNGDYEAEHGLPPEAQKLKDRVAAASGFMIACPEYNHSVPGVLKNAIDWTSRKGGQVWAGKTVALMAASGGPSGGLRGLMALRQVLTPLGVWLVPGQVTIAGAAKAFDESGALVDDTFTKLMEGVVTTLVDRLG